MPTIDVLEGDITTIAADAIVNATNRAMRAGGGVDGAVHRAGGPAILADCIARYPDGLQTGDAGWTTGGALPAHWVIHTVGPNYTAGQQDRALLASCYMRALEVADELGARSVAFPLVSAGAYGWPKDDAVATAIETIAATPTAVEHVSLVVRDAETRQTIETALGRWTPLRILQSVRILHERGVHAARVLPGMSASGMHWRVAIAAAHEFESQGDYLYLRDWDRALVYTSGAATAFAGGRVDVSTSPEQVADMLRERVPGLQAASRDAAYVDWYAQLLRIVEAIDRLPVAYADYYDHEPAWEIGWGSGILYPPPPSRD